MQKYIVEFVGTFFLVLVVALSANPLAVGAILMCMVYMGGYISGAHYNPAVTLAVFLRKGISGSEMVKYVCVQLLGAIAASFVYLLTKNQMFHVEPGKGVPFLTAYLLETLFTFALCSVVLHTATSEENTSNQFYGLAIGFTVLAGAYTVGTISGAAFNPAVGVGPILADLGQLTNHLSELLLYTIGPLTGAAVASLLYLYHSPKKKK